MYLFVNMHTLSVLRGQRVRSDHDSDMQGDDISTSGAWRRNRYGMSPIRVIFSLQDSYDLLLTIISTKNLNNCVQMFHAKSLMRCKAKMHDRYTVTQCWLMFMMRKIHNFRRYMWSREFSLLNLNQKLKFLVFKNINAVNKRCKQLIFLILLKTRRESDK